MSQQSFRTVFVTNSPTLLAQGATVESLGVHQIAILDAKTHLAVTSPTYATTKALEVVWGTPDLGDLPLMSGVPNQNDYSKLIKGKLLTGFRGKAAKRPKQEVVTVGWSGDDADTDTLFAQPGQVKHLFIKLTGAPIDKVYSVQGVIRQFSTKAGTTDDCGDPCTEVDCRLLVDDLVQQINNDPQIGINSKYSKNRYIKASSIVTCTTPPSVTSDTDYVFDLTVCDTRDDIALGIVQAQYPDDVVKRVGVIGASSVYEVVRDTNSTPTAFSNAGLVIVPDCETCPSGYSTVPAGMFVYTVTREDAGTAGATTTVESNYSIGAAPESATRIAYQFGASTYVLVSSTALTAFAATDTLVFVSETTRPTCTLTTPTTIAWVANGTLTKFGKKFRLTIADDCAGDRFTDVQAAYPDLVVTEVSASGTCVHTFETTVFSQPVLEGCSEDELVFIKPDAFEGIEWVEVSTLTGSGCKCGIRLESAFVNRITNECTFDYFPYESDTIHIQASSFDPDYNKSPDELDWVVKKIQNFEHAAGFGAHIRELERESKSYYLRERSFDPVVREIEGYQFATDPNKYYDEYALEFDFEYLVGGWAQKYTDSYTLFVYFPEGEGKNFEAAINGYIASAALQLDPVVL